MCNVRTKASRTHYHVTGYGIMLICLLMCAQALLNDSLTNSWSEDTVRPGRFSFLSAAFRGTRMPGSSTSQPVAYSPNSQYSYEVADAINTRTAPGGNTSWDLSQDDHYAPLQAAVNAQASDGNVHSLSSRFNFRTSLFSYNILNRTARPGAI